MTSAYVVSDCSGSLTLKRERYPRRMQPMPPEKQDQGQSLEGERVVYAGGPDQSSLVGLSGTLNPIRDQIKPQSIELRVFAEDYLPDRPRQYSAPFIVHILSKLIMPLG